MNRIKGPIFTALFSLVFLSLSLGEAYGREKPEVIRLEARYTEELVKINVHWQSANPVTLIHAIIGKETKEIEVDEYDNRRNPDGYEGEATIMVSAFPSPGADSIPYIIQIEDDLRQKSEQVAGSVKTAVAAAGDWAPFQTGTSSTGLSGDGNRYQTGTGTYPGYQTEQDPFTKAKQGQPGELIDKALDLIKGRESEESQQAGADPYGQDQYPPAGDEYYQAPQEQYEEYAPFVLQNDQFQSGGAAIFLDVLNQGDEVAVVLGDGSWPFTVTKVHFLFSGSSETVNMTLKISEGSGAPSDSEILVEESLEVPPSDMGFLPMDLVSWYGQGVPVSTGIVRVSFQMEHAGLPGIGIDTNTAAASGRNWVRRSGSWSNFETAGIQGNAIIRVEVQ